MSKAKTTGPPDSSLVAVELPPPRRARPRFAAATVVSLVGSLAACRLLVALAEGAFPVLRGFSHFRFVDYGGLTVIGVLAAATAWAVVGRTSGSPRRVFLRLVLAVSVLAFVPDVVLIVRHEPARAVAALMVMHVVVALVTYNALVRIAPAGLGGRKVASPATEPTGRAGPGVGAFACMAASATVELLLGAGVVTVLPGRRRGGLDPPHAAALYLLHGVFGGVVAAGALALLAASLTGERSRQRAALAGTAGLLVAALGGLLTPDASLRLAGAALMLLGGCAGTLAYALAAVELSRSAPPAGGGTSPPVSSPVPRDELGRELDQWGHPRETWGKGVVR